MCTSEDPPLHRTGGENLSINEVIAGWSVSSRFVIALALVGRLMDGFLMREILETAADKLIMKH